MLERFFWGDIVQLKQGLLCLRTLGRYRSFVTFQQKDAGIPLRMTRRNIVQLKQGLLYLRTLGRYRSFIPIGKQSGFRACPEPVEGMTARPHTTGHSERTKRAKNLNLRCSLDQNGRQIQ